MTERIQIKRANKVVDVFFGEEGWEPHEHTRLLMVSTKNGMFPKYRDWETDRKSTRLNSSH